MTVLHPDDFVKMVLMFPELCTPAQRREAHHIIVQRMQCGLRALHGAERPSFGDVSEAFRLVEYVPREESK